jgi:hypothetical protein
LAVEVFGCVAVAMAVVGLFTQMSKERLQTARPTWLKHQVGLHRERLKVQDGQHLLNGLPPPQNPHPHPPPNLPPPLPLQPTLHPLPLLHPPRHLPLQQ